MNLKSIVILCSSDSEPDDLKRFVWSEGDDLFSVECAIAKLQEWVDQRKPQTPVDLALLNSTPIDNAYQHNTTER